MEIIFFKEGQAHVRIGDLACQVLEISIFSLTTI